MKTRVGSEASFSSSSYSFVASATPAAVDADVACAAVDHQLAGVHAVSLRPARAAQHGSDPAEQLVVDQRRGDIVVRTAGASPDTVDRIAPVVAEHDHGDVAVPAAGSPSRRRVRTSTAGASGNPPAEHDEVGLRALGELERLVCGRGL